MPKQSEKKGTFKQYARGTGYYLTCTILGLVVLCLWVSVNLLVSNLTYYGISHWSFWCILLLGIVPPLICFPILKSVRNRFARKMSAKVSADLQAGDEALGELFAMFTDPDDAYMYGAFAGNRWIQTVPLVLFWFGLAVVGIVLERLFRLKETFIILDFSTYSILLKTWITFVSLLAVQLFIYIWNKGLARGIRRVVWGGPGLFVKG